MSGPSFEEVRRGRRIIAKVATFANGRRCYFALRRHEDIWRPEREGLSDAMRAGRAGWAIESDMLRRYRAKGVEFAGVMVKRLGDTYMAPIDLFFTPGIASSVVVVKSHEPYKLVPLSVFQLKRAEIAL